MKLLPLPGMDERGDLFGPFAAEVASWATPQVVRYPNQPQSVDELADQITLTEPVTVIAESFSGAVGIKLAAKSAEAPRCDKEGVGTDSCTIRRYAPRGIAS